MSWINNYIDFDKPWLPVNRWVLGSSDTTEQGYFRVRPNNTGVDAGSCVTTAYTQRKVKWTGTRALRAYIYHGIMALLTKPKAPGNTYKWCRQLGDNPWDEAGTGANTDRINGMRFWIKGPVDLSEWDHGGNDATFHIGTYLEGSGDPSEQEEPGTNHHFYHRYNLPFADTWTMCIMDWKPYTQRQDQNEEHYEQYPYSSWGAPEKNWNYFDTLKTFYIRNDNNGTENPDIFEEWFVDQIQFIEDSHLGEVSHASSVSAAYHPVNDQFGITWTGRKDKVPTYDIRYAFSDCIALGWNNLTTISNGTGMGYGNYTRSYVGCITPPGEIDVTGRDFVYFAIKSSQQSDNEFRQVVVAVNHGGMPPL